MEKIVNVNQPPVFDQDGHPTNKLELGGIGDSIEENVVHGGKDGDKDTLH